MKDWWLAAALVLAAGAARAGAWTEPAGGTQVISSFRTSLAWDGFDANGRSVSIPAFRKEELDIYSATGLTDSTTLIVHPDFTNYHPDAPSRGATGFGNTEIGIEERLWHDETQVLSLQTTALLPGRSIITSGGIDGEVRALYGRAFTLFGVGAFADAELAWRLRSRGYAGELRPEFTLGLKPDTDWQVLLQSFSIVVIGHGRTLLFQGEQARLQLSAVYRLNETLSLQTGAFATLAGSNTPAERGLLTALWLRF
jgi:hypothetical protein